MTLDVVIATYKPEGILRVARMLLPEQEGVKYIVSWQCHGDAPLPECLQRKDIKVLRSDSIGSSANRNLGIEQTTGDIVYLADDDIEILPGALKKIMERFRNYPDTQVATFMMKEVSRKNYPKQVTELSFYLPKGYSVATYQMAFRRDIFPLVRFNEAFGINSGVFESGEDELFHLSARKKGLKCRFFPDILASHPHEATGRRKIFNPKVLHGMGALITVSYPKTFMLRLPLAAFRLHKQRRHSFFPAFFSLYVGSFKMLRYLLKPDSQL